MRNRQTGIINYAKIVATSEYKLVKERESPSKSDKDYYRNG